MAGARRRGGPPLRFRITIAFLAVALIPVAGVGILAAATGHVGDVGIQAAFLAAIVGAALLALLVAGYIVEVTARGLRDLTSDLDRIAAGGAPAIGVAAGAEDELGRLADRQAQLASDLMRRNRQVARVVAAVAAANPADGPARALANGAADAVSAFDLIDARIVPGDPDAVTAEERIPGDPLPLRAPIRAGARTVGTLVAHLPATARWERGDQELLELHAAIIGAGVRTAELIDQVETQNERLVALDQAKDDFLRAVSHNLQTPLARIRAYADQLADEAPDRRLAIIVEQSDRLSRMVRQVLTVSRLDSGMLRPVPDIFAPAAAVRRAWEALGAEDVPFELVDGARGWLAVADPGEIDQVLWALLDNALRYGAGGPVGVVIGVEEGPSRVAITIRDGGPGVAAADRDRLFGRFARGSGTGQEGTGLGLYVARSLARANEGDLCLEPAYPARPGAAFTLRLPAESPTEA